MPTPWKKYRTLYNQEISIDITDHLFLFPPYKSPLPAQRHSWCNLIHMNACVSTTLGKRQSTGTPCVASESITYSASSLLPSLSHTLTSPQVAFIPLSMSACQQWSRNESQYLIFGHSFPTQFPWDLSKWVHASTVCSFLVLGSILCWSFYYSLIKSHVTYFQFVLLWMALLWQFMYTSYKKTRFFSFS